MSATVMKMHCYGCPFDYGADATEMALNLGCLPSIQEINLLCENEGTAWACHSAPQAVCFGHTARASLALQYLVGVHQS